MKWNHISVACFLRVLSLLGTKGLGAEMSERAEWRTDSLLVLSDFMGFCDNVKKCRILLDLFFKIEDCKMKGRKKNLNPWKERACLEKHVWDKSWITVEKKRKEKKSPHLAPGRRTALNTKPSAYWGSLNFTLENGGNIFLNESRLPLAHIL